MKDAHFEPFRQGESARGGVGIGLSLVNRFARLHGGDAARRGSRRGRRALRRSLPGQTEHIPEVAPLHAV